MYTLDQECAMNLKLPCGVVCQFLYMNNVLLKHIFLLTKCGIPFINLIIAHLCIWFCSRHKVKITISRWKNKLKWMQWRGYVILFFFYRKYFKCTLFSEHFFFFLKSWLLRIWNAVERCDLLRPMPYEVWVFLQLRALEEMRFFSKFHICMLIRLTPGQIILEGLMFSKISEVNLIPAFKWLPENKMHWTGQV